MAAERLPFRRAPGTARQYEVPGVGLVSRREAQRLAGRPLPGNAPKPISGARPARRPAEPRPPSPRRVSAARERSRNRGTVEQGPRGALYVRGRPQRQIVPGLIWQIGDVAPNGALLPPCIQIAASAGGVVKTLVEAGRDVWFARLELETWAEARARGHPYPEEVLTGWGPALDDLIKATGGKGFIDDSQELDKQINDRGVYAAASAALREHGVYERVC